MLTSLLHLPQEMPLEDLRRARGVTQWRFLKDSGLSHQWFYELETGASQPTVHSVQKYIETLGGRLSLVAVFNDTRDPVRLKLKQLKAGNEFSAMLETLPAATLPELRRAFGISAISLGLKCKMSKNTVGEIETGKQMPRASTLRRLVKGLKGELKLVAEFGDGLSAVITGIGGMEETAHPVARSLPAAPLVEP